jgi:arylsulfatase A-like enzyme
VIAAPGVTPRRIPRPVGLADLAPTLLDLAGFVPPGMPEMDGASFADVLRGVASPRLDAGAAYVVQLRDRSVARTLRAVVLGGHKLIVDEADAPIGLYDLVADPHETRDLRAGRPELVARLRRELARRREIDRILPAAR